MYIVYTLECGTKKTFNGWRPEGLPLNWALLRATLAVRYMTLEGMHTASCPMPQRLLLVLRQVSLCLCTIDTVASFSLCKDERLKRNVKFKCWWWFWTRDVRCPIFCLFLYLHDHRPPELSGAGVPCRGNHLRLEINSIHHRCASTDHAVQLDLRLSQSCPAPVLAWTCSGGFSLHKL